MILKSMNLIESIINKPAKKYIKNNVAQCWKCKNRIGEHLACEDEIFLLPECKILDLYVTHVYKEICKNFEEGDTE